MPSYIELLHAHWCDHLTLFIPQIKLSCSGAVSLSSGTWALLLLPGLQYNTWSWQYQALHCGYLGLSCIGDGSVGLCGGGGVRVVGHLRRIPDDVVELGDGVEVPICLGAVITVLWIFEWFFLVFLIVFWFSSVHYSECMMFAFRIFKTDFFVYDRL